MKDLCNKDEMLGDYLEGRLSGSAKSQMEEHLSSCGTCMETLVVGNSLIRGGNQAGFDDVPGKVTDAAIKLLRNQNVSPAETLKHRFMKFWEALYSTLVDHLNFWRKRQLAPVRSSKTIITKDLMRLKKTFKEIDVEIEIEKTGKRHSTIRVSLINDAKGTKGIRVTLQKENEREISCHTCPWPSCRRCCLCRRMEEEMCQSRYLSYSW